jgi:hypothetical protein
VRRVEGLGLPGLWAACPYAALRVA